MIAFDKKSVFKVKTYEKKDIIQKKDSKKLLVKEYIRVLEEIRTQVEQSQIEAVTAVNIALNKRNWIMGKIIFENKICINGDQIF